MSHNLGRTLRLVSDVWPGQSEHLVVSRSSVFCRHRCPQEFALVGFTQESFPQIYRYDVLQRDGVVFVHRFFKNVVSVQPQAIPLTEVATIFFIYYTFFFPLNVVTFVFHSFQFEIVYQFMSSSSNCSSSTWVALR
jgi:hypothetical protein